MTSMASTPLSYLGVGVVADEGVCALHHEPRVVGVEVERGDQRLVPEDPLHLREHTPLDVVVVLSDAGSVEVHGDPVELPRTLDALEDLPQKGVEGLGRDGPRGGRRGEHGGHELEAVPRASVHEAPDRSLGTPMVLEDLLPVEEAPLLELL